MVSFCWYNNEERGYYTSNQTLAGFYTIQKWSTLFKKSIYKHPEVNCLRNSKMALKWQLAKRFLRYWSKQSFIFGTIWPITHKLSKIPSKNDRHLWRCGLDVFHITRVYWLRSIYLVSKFKTFPPIGTVMFAYWTTNSLNLIISKWRFEIFYSNFCLFLLEMYSCKI